MISIKNLQDMVQKTRLDARNNASGLAAVSVGIYDLAMHALMSDVLTLGRITRVVQAVQNGIEDFTSKASDNDVASQAILERGAYQGLCSAATDGLTAVGLAQAQFCKFSGRRLSTEFSAALWQETLECKRQIDQINIVADWPVNSQINLIQTHWFDQLLQHLEEQNLKQENTAVMHWSQVLFQSRGYKAKTEESELQENMMLLGLISSGALLGLQATHAAA